MKALTFSTLAIVALFAVSTSSFAQSRWAKNHPRRNQVNNRIENQHDRVHDEVKEGDLSKKQAKNIRKEDHQIRKEERRDASNHNGHITKREQNHLNHQENQVSRQIGQ